MRLGTLWLVGCGNMAGAMLSRWLQTGLDPASITVIRPSGTLVAPGVRVVTTVPDEPPPQTLLLGLKPQQLADAVPELHPASGGATLVSILAGVRTETLRRHFPAAAAIVRAMPNLPVALGQGVVALTGDHDERVAALMQPLGFVDWFDEERFNLVTALAGSGPAFAYRFVDALSTAAVRLGLPHGQAQALALATANGALALATSGQVPVAALADRVASKGGSTRAGLDVLDADERLVALLTDTLAAATRRNEELGG